ncbi:hypothetical protein [Streptomyces alboniger]|uniref:hypothetical protein n=1 Tax=Streptomyces alboniger TaxID=132473 RepID=UPI0018F88B53|nr:hypothetical protein [Streptomyces alboniger]
MSVHGSRDGEAGAPGAGGTAGPPGPQGEPGPPGKDADGEEGRDGESCPDGYSAQPPTDDPDALVCRRDGTPDPEPDDRPASQTVLDPSRRQYP